jgi:hypothetical protein
MQLAGIRGADRRADRVDEPRPADPRRQPPAQQVGPVPQARGPDADDAGCSARHRPAGPAPSGSSDDQEPVQALGADRADPSLRVRVRCGCPVGRHQHLATFRAEHVVEAAGELRVPVTEQEAHSSPSLLQHQQPVAGLLGDPGAVRVGGHPGQVHPPGVVFYEEQHIQPSQPDCVDGEEVARHDPGGLLAQERPPGAGWPPRRRVESVTAKRCADRGGRDAHTKPLQLALERW